MMNHKLAKLERLVINSSDELDCACIIWLVYFAFIAIFAIIYHTVGYSDFPYCEKFLAGLVLFCNFSYMFYAGKGNKLFRFLAIALLLRFGVAILTAYNIGNVNAIQRDTNGFHLYAAWGAEKGKFISVYGGMYTPLITIIYMLVGPMRLVSTMSNCLFAITVFLFMAALLKRIHVSKRNIDIAIMIGAFCPSFIWTSGSLLREMMMQTSIIGSLLLFERWFTCNKILPFMLALIVTLPAINMHCGTIGFVVAYFIIFFLYSPLKRCIKSGKSFAIKLLLAGVVAVLLITILFQTKSFHYFSNKFDNIADSEIELAVTRQAEGGSAYLTFLEGHNNIFLLIFMMPLICFYFMFSPMPWNWRGLTDLAMFFGDSIVYIFLLIYIIKHIKHLPKVRKQFVYCVLLAVGMLFFIFSAGTHNAGTAVRHRGKGLPSLLICFALCLPDKRGSKNTIKIDDKADEIG